MNETDEAPEKLSDVYFDIDICYDPRVQWFKERILSFTGIQDEEVFYNMLGEGNTRQKLASFILAPIRPYDLSLDRRVFFISKIIVDKLIHEEKEFTEWRIIPPPPPPVVQHKKGKKGKKAKVEAPVESDPEATEDDDKIRGKSGKVVRAGKGTKVAKKSAKIKDEAEIDTVASTVTEPFDLDTSKASENPEGKPKVASDDTFPLPPENLDPEIDGVLEYYTVLRSVPRMVQYPKLIASFGALTPQTVDRSRKYIYFIRQCQDEIPLAESGYITKLTMPEYMLVGSTSGKILMSLGTQLKETFISLYENQSREILITSREDEQPMMHRKSSAASGEVALEVNYLRPSDYRRMSNIARGENAARRCV